VALVTDRGHQGLDSRITVIGGRSRGALLRTGCSWQARQASGARTTLLLYNVGSAAMHTIAANGHLHQAAGWQLGMQEKTEAGSALNG
jgi:hypothetical protein